jgi:hypothetical protein
MPFAITLRLDPVGPAAVEAMSRIAHVVRFRPVEVLASDALAD